MDVREDTADVHGAPAAVPVRAIDLVLSSTGHFGSQRRGHEGNRRTQLALWPPALISIPIRKWGGRKPPPHLLTFWSGTRLGWLE